VQELLQICGATHNQMRSHRAVVNTDQPLSESATDALERIFVPLAALMIECGVTAHDACQVLRRATVRTAAKRARGVSGQATKSRVAAITGLSRTEVSRHWNSDNPQKTSIKSTLRPAQRILAAWYNSPVFLGPNGDPDTLPIFGTRRSFQRLVESHGAGIPVRAMLDELISTGAVELLSNQRVKAKARIPVRKGFTRESVHSIGERISDYIEALIKNLAAEAPLFEASTGPVDADPDSLAIIRREMASRGTSFFSNIEHLIKTAGSRSTGRTTPGSFDYQVGVGIYYFEKPLPAIPEQTTPSVRRRNLRRKNVRKGNVHE
jgi:hypothetical protein